MSGVVAEPAAARGYGPVLASRHLWRGPLSPIVSTREALAAGIGEWGRLTIFALFVLTLGLTDPETRSLGLAALENTADDPSRLRGLTSLAVGAALFGCVLYLGYWVAAIAASVLCGQGWTPAALARMRSVVALSAWFSLLPTVAVKVLAMSVLPARMVAADPPSLFSSIEAVMVMPYFAACLVASCGIGLARAALGASLVNGGFYLLVVILYLLSPS